MNEKDNCVIFETFQAKIIRFLIDIINNNDGNLVNVIAISKHNENL